MSVMRLLNTLELRWRDLMSWLMSVSDPFEI